MNLLDLPVELGILIIDYLDLNAKANLYDAIDVLKKYFMPTHIRKVKFSHSCQCAPVILKQTIFKDLSLYVKELNLSCVPNITVHSIQCHLERMINLEILDLTFTDIYLPEFIDICPNTVKDISVNFFKFPILTEPNIWEKCKRFFSEKFNKIHFVVFELFESELPLSFLEDVTRLIEIKVTVTDNYKNFGTLPEGWLVPLKYNLEPQCDKLSYNFKDCKVTHRTAKCLKGVINLNFNKFEYIFTMYLEKIVVYVSPIFKGMFADVCSDFKLKVTTKLPRNFMLDGNIIFKAWNKETTVFDEKFFESLAIEYKDMFPTFVCTHSGVNLKIINAKSDWLCVDSCQGFDKMIMDVPNIITITQFCRRTGNVFRDNTPISLTPESAMKLRNITFLRLSNIFVDDLFFFNLFTSCKDLNTLDVHMENDETVGIFRGLISQLSSSLHLASRLRNLKLTIEEAEYEILFGALSLCASLENVHICEYMRVIAGHIIIINNVKGFIEKCSKLYSVFIESDTSAENLTLLTSPLVDAAQKCGRNCLTIQVYECYSTLNIFGDVFNPSPLNVID